MGRPTTKIISLICGLLFCASSAVAAAPPRPDAPVVYSPRNIVTNATGPECPTTNVFFDKETEFNYEELPKYQAHIKDQGVSERCQAMAISDIAACYVDRSFSIKHGCCSQKCSQGVRKVAESGCGIEFRAATCKEGSAQPLLAAMDALNKRCANHTELTCEEALAQPLQVLLAKHRAGSSGPATGPVEERISAVAQLPKPGQPSSSSGGGGWRQAWHWTLAGAVAVTVVAAVV